MEPLMQSTGKKPRTGVVISCGVCGVKFYTPPCGIGRRKYCSGECRIIADRTRKPKVCVFCGKEFIAGTNNVGLYCKRACYTASRQPRKACKVCDTLLSKSSLTYCSRACNDKGRKNGFEKPCESCGKAMYVEQKQAKRFCSRECSHEGKRIDGAGAKQKRKDGYIQVYYPKHPDGTRNGFVLEHRLVAEQKYGRRILKTEHVHHLNGVKDDNRPENLEVISPSAHARISTAQGKAQRKEIKNRLEEAEKRIEEYERRFGSLEGE